MTCSLPSESTWERTVSKTWLLASVSKVNGTAFGDRSGYAKMVALMRAVLRSLKAASHSCVCSYQGDSCMHPAVVVRIAKQRACPMVIIGHGYVGKCTTCTFQITFKTLN